MSIDLAAVCARHGITTHSIEPEKCLVVWRAREDVAGLYYATEADAVCALLKARWGITSYRHEYRGWCAHRTEEVLQGLSAGDARHEVIVHSQPDELAAVVALDDRLAATAPEAGC